MRDTIEMAREAGAIHYWHISRLKAFEAIVRADERNRVWSQKHWTQYEQDIAAAEREACAKVCDVLAVHPEYASDITKLAASAIRARGEN